MVPLAVAESKNEIWAYVPEAYDPAVPHGLVVWLHGQAAVSRKELLARWKPLCDRYDLILAAPRSGDPTGWKAEEAALVDEPDPAGPDDLPRRWDAGGGLRPGKRRHARLRCWRSAAGRSSPPRP